MPAPAAIPYRLGVDIGGTFTDVVLETPGGLFSTKVLTTYAAPEAAILDGLQQVCARAGIAPADLGQIIHGTTLATNALIERRGAHTALITTEGFRDVIEMRSESRFEQYDLNLTLPEPLLPRGQRHTVPGRIDATGAELLPLPPEAIAQVVDEIAQGGYDSAAIGLIHAYLNPSHEIRIRDALRARLPDLSVSISSEVSPQMREYERFNTTVANAYIKPLMASYLGRLEEKLRGLGTDCPIFMMHSGGGIISLADAAEFPVRLVESGPAGGAVFAADLAARHGLERVLSFDMGGTTAKICLIRDQSPKTARVFEVARSYRFKKGSGMPISIPVIDMVEIGAGGGSLAHVDAMGQIRVGPESAGSEPGPACYGRGGTRPAVTDADLILGKLDPQGFAGGTIDLFPEKSQTALEDALGALGLSASEAAHGVAEVVDETMANAARVHAVENGEDLAGYTMVGFGGAAPLHAGRLCQKLGISRLIVPPGAGVGSAIGFLRAPFSFEATRSAYMRLSGFDAAAALALTEALQAEATGFVAACLPKDITAPQIETELQLYMRYLGQGWEIPVAVPPQDLADLDAGRLQALFEAEYHKLFARIVAGLDIEITVFALRAATPNPAPDPVAESAPLPAPAPIAERAIFDAGTQSRARAPVYARADLRPGAEVIGPAAIIEAETTIILPAGFTARACADGSITCQQHGATAPATPEVRAP